MNRIDFCASCGSFWVLCLLTDLHVDDRFNEILVEFFIVTEVRCLISDFSRFCVL